MNPIEKILFHSCAAFMPDVDMEVVRLFVQLGERRELKPKDLFRSDRFIFDEVWMMESGLTRAFTFKDNREFTFDFYTAGFLILEIESYYDQKLCNFLYEALTPTIYYSWKMKDVESFLSKYPKYKAFEQIFIEEGFVRHINKIINLQAGTLKDRYLALLNLHGDLIEKVPQYYLASYLGIKPPSLSRLKNSINAQS